MAVLIYTESENGKFKKNAFELASYGKEIANSLSTSLIAVSFNNPNLEELKKYGVDKLISLKGDCFSQFKVKTFSEALTEVIKSEGIKFFILSSSSNARSIAPIITAKTGASYASNVIEIPSSYEPFTVKRSVFSNKAFSSTELKNDIKIISLNSNSFGLKEINTETTLEERELSIEDNSTEVLKTDKVTGKISIADADIVVSGGRGLKGPENWNLIEDLATTLGAATACSKPVSDLGWRPHSEHVGQTGKPVASNLYIAIGISGAIQHLAGINASKVKVVINTDPEAPFFKAADYGIVGDAFKVVPELTKKLKAFKEANK